MKVAGSVGGDEAQWYDVAAGIGEADQDLIVGRPTASVDRDRLSGHDVIWGDGDFGLGQRAIGWDDYRYEQSGDNGNGEAET